MKTKITEMFGIERPIVQGGMHYVGFAEMAAAVSNAGGLGIITALTQKTPADLANEIARCKDMTDKPFGVNITFLPSTTPPDYPGIVEAVIKGGVKVVETAGNNPSAVLPALQGAGIKVIHKCTAVRHALKAQSIGCDAVSSTASNAAATRAKTTCRTSSCCRAQPMSWKSLSSPPAAWPMAARWSPRSPWARRA
jgi:NAD(P)H-dependent flavin oxidoreductase YrpB (nitropropane dioxygenase family)